MLVFRLPIGARPELGASSVVSIGVPATTVTTSSVFDDAIREQTRADLQAVVASAVRLYPIWKSYAPATSAVLGRTLPQFGFVTGAEISKQVGTLSVHASSHSFALAEYAGPGRCAFARVVDRHPPQYVAPTPATCRALPAPSGGWVALGS